VAQLLVDPTNPRFTKGDCEPALKLTSLGLFEPWTIFRLETFAEHPELLEWLAQDFRAPRL